MSRIDESLPFHPVRIALLTVSDTVRSAMRTGWKGSDSSMRDMEAFQSAARRAFSARRSAQASRLAGALRSR